MAIESNVRMCADIISSLEDKKLLTKKVAIGMSEEAKHALLGEFGDGGQAVDIQATVERAPNAFHVFDGVSLVVDNEVVGGNLTVVEW